MHYYSWQCKNKVVYKRSCLVTYMASVVTIRVQMVCICMPMRILPKELFIG